MTEHPCILNTISLSDVQTTHINFTETVDTESTKKVGLALRLKGMKYRYESCSKFKKKKGGGRTTLSSGFLRCYRHRFWIGRRTGKEKRIEGDW